MNENDLYQRFFASAMFSDWHWFSWHFEHRRRGGHHPLAHDIVRALLDCDEAIPGFAAGMCNELAAIGGREKHVPHWEQLLQRMAEIHVIRQAVTCSWPESPAFKWEPQLTKDGKNPELLVKWGKQSLGIEVKAPSLVAHINKRSRNPVQVGSRFATPEVVKTFTGDGSVTLPRDNPVKDFLLSANAKFQPFAEADQGFHGLLVIVWDDFIYEPISGLTHPNCGLLTPNSFFRNEEGKPMTFPYVDGIVVIRHLHQLMHSTRDEPFDDSCTWTFDYGDLDTFPFKAYIVNAAARGIPLAGLECFQGREPHPALGAEYLPKDITWWIG